MLLSFLLACATDPDAPSETPVATGDPEAASLVQETADTPDPAEDSVGTRAASLYALDLPLRTQTGAEAHLDVARGHPVLFSMFYTSCPMACPLLIQDIQSLEDGLAPEVRADLRVVLVSLDPAQDDPAAMREVIERHGLDTSRWTLGAVPEGDVREVAAALGVRYRPLEGGGFAHTAVLTLVDRDGKIVARSEGSDGRDALVRAIGELAR